LNLDGIDPKALRASMKRHAREWGITAETADGFTAYNRATGVTLTVRGKSATFQRTGYSQNENERAITNARAETLQGYGVEIATTTLKHFGFKASTPTRTADGAVRITFKR
jgi:hypothetical protein